MAFVVIYDACVLYPAPLRDLLIRIACTGVVRARWTELILDECFESIQRDRPDLDSIRLQRTRRLMNHSIRDVAVTGYESLIEGVSLPDPNDRHVVAAAIRAGAQAIITFNIKDFPESALNPFGLEAKHPDDFVLDTLHLAPGALCAAVNEQATALKNPPISRMALLETLNHCGLSQSVAKLKALFGAT